MKKEDYEFVSVSLLPDRGKSIVEFKEKVSIITEDGEIEERWFKNSITPSVFPSDDLLIAIRKLSRIYAFQCGKKINDETFKLESLLHPDAIGVRVTFFSIKKDDRKVNYCIKGLLREPSGHYNKYAPKELDEAARLFYDVSDELPSLAENISDECYQWITAKKYDNYGIQKLWDD